MAYSMEASGHACYPGTTCLINKLGIQDEPLLAQIEGGITLLKAAELEVNPLPGSFDFAHYKRIHRFLFEDIFSWAGEVRDVNLSKKGTRFVEADDIERIAQPLFSNIEKHDCYRGLSHPVYIKKIAQLYHDVNMLHPFREGNGRTQRCFFAQLIRAAGYDIHFGNCDTDFLMIATIQAAHGVLDYLKQFFTESIRKK